MYTWYFLCINMFQLVHHPQNCWPWSCLGSSKADGGAKTSACATWAAECHSDGKRGCRCYRSWRMGKPWTSPGLGPGEMVRWISLGFSLEVFVPYPDRLVCCFLAIDWNVFLFFEHADTWFRNQVLQGLLKFLSVIILFGIGNLDSPQDTVFPRAIGGLSLNFLKIHRFIFALLGW